MTDPINPLFPFPLFSIPLNVLPVIFHKISLNFLTILFTTPPLLFLLKPTRKIFIQPLLFVNIMTLIYTKLTPILLLQIQKNPQFLFPLLLSQLALTPFEKTFILTIFISQLLMSLQPFSIICKKNITFYLNMFSTLLLNKTFSKRNLLQDLLQDLYKTFCRMLV